MKRLFMICLALIGVTILLLVGNTSEASAAEQQIKLKFAYFAGETTSFARNILKPWLAQMEKATNGRVKVDVYWGAALAAGKDQLDAISGGLADMTWNPTHYNPGRFLATEIITLPFLGFPDALPPTRVLWKLYDQFPAVKKEFGDVHPLIIHAGHPGQLATRKIPVRKADDLKGVKIRASAGPTSDAVQKMGGVPIAMPIMDIYQSIEKGVIEGTLLDLQGVRTRKLYEITNFFSIVNMFAMPFIVPFNKKKWDTLPPDIQAQIMSVSGLEGSLVWAKHFNEEAEECLKIIKSTPGKEIISPSPAEMQTFVNAAKPTWDEYLERLKASGKPGKEIFDEMVRLQREYK